MAEKRYHQDGVPDPETVILLMLGRLEEGMTRLREDFSDEKISAAESRATVLRRLDDQVSSISAMKTDAALIKQKVEGLAKSSETEVRPAVEEWKQMKRTGTAFAGLLAIGGLSAGGLLVWAGDQVATAIRHWLRIV